jgi:hypothetical protein
MQSHVIAASRWLRRRRFEVAVAVALVCALAALAVVGPWLLAVAALEWKYGKRRKRLLGIALATLLASAVVWLWREMRGAPHRAWHPCAQCGVPIEAPSRAAYCSHACRRYARLERDALDDDPRIAERAEQRLRNLCMRAIADGDPELAEVLF